MKKLVTKMICLLILCFAFISVNAATKNKTIENETVNTVSDAVLSTTTQNKEKIKAYVFYKDGCPYCEKMLEYLEELKESDIKDYFEIVKYQVWDSSWNVDKHYQKIMKKVASNLGQSVDGAPFLVIGEYSVNGFSDEYKDAIKNAIVTAYESDSYVDKVEEVSQDLNSDDSSVIISILAGVAVIVAGFIFFSRKSK